MAITVNVQEVAPINVDVEEIGIIAVSVDGGINPATVNGTLTGAKNGTNKVFTTSSDFVTGSTAVYINGLRQPLGVHYTETAANQITFSDAPIAWDQLSIDFSNA